MPEPEFPRELFRHFVTGVGLVTSYNPITRRANVQAAEWTFNTSYRPFQISVFINPSHYTFELINQTKEFGVSVASTQQAGLAHAVGNASGRTVDKFAEFKIQTVPSQTIKPPLIAGAVLHAECKVKTVHNDGDHVQFVGDVQRAELFPDRQPLAYHQGKFYRLGEQLEKQDPTTHV